MRFTPVLGLLLLAPGVCLAEDSLAEAVRCAEVGFSRSVENHDLEAFAAFVDPDARFAAGSIHRGRDEVVAGWTGLVTNTDIDMRWRPAITEVLPSGDLALSRGPYRIRRSDEAGNPVESWGHFISTWRRADDGRWLVLFDSGGDDGMTPTDAERALIDTEPCLGDSSS